MKQRDELTRLPNIGDELARQLRAVGIESAEQLRTVGAKEAWLRILGMDDSACIMRLRGLEGAVQGIRKNDLSDAVKADLKAFYHEANGAKK